MEESAYRNELLFKYYFTRVISFKDVEIYDLDHETDSSPFSLFSSLSGRSLDEIKLNEEQTTSFMYDFPNKNLVKDFWSLNSLVGEDYVIRYRKENDENHLRIIAERYDASQGCKSGQKIIVSKQKTKNA